MFKKKPKLVLIVFLLVFTFVSRLFLTAVAHHGDLNNNLSWGQIAVKGGLNGFYELKDWPYSAPNQPPLTILLLSGVSWLEEWVRNSIWVLNTQVGIFPSSLIWFWQDHGQDLMVKLPSILADFGIAWLIYWYFRKKEKKELGLKLALVWLFNPVVWYNSSIWGQTDSIVNFLGLIAIFFLLNKKLIFFAVFLTLSLLFKGSLVIFVPVLFIIAVLQKHKLSEWLRAMVFSLLTVVLVSVWFHPQLDLPIWLFNLYQQRILPGEIGYLTANAFNFWWLVDSGKTLDSTIYLGLPARLWGLIISLIAIGLLIYKLIKTKVSDKKVFFSLALTALITFLFMTRIHERYLYPFFPISTILLGLTNIIIPYAILSITHLLNLYHLFWAPGIPTLINLYRFSWFGSGLSVINLGVLFYFLLKSKNSES